MKVTFHHDEFSKRRTKTLHAKAAQYRRKLKKWSKTPSVTAPEYALFVAGDTAYQKNIQRSLKNFKGIQHVILVGIGGSSLGTEAVYQALAYKTGATLSIFDSVDREALEKLESFLGNIHDFKSIALVVVSKSGTTVETMGNAVRVYEICEGKYGKDFNTQTIFIGDKDTPFFKIGKKYKVTCIPMPDSVGGRFSVFTSVGIVPLTLLGIDVISFCEGSQAALQEKELKHIEERAVSLALHAEAGVHTVNFFTFNKRLRYCGDWYRQLLAESIGKSMTTKGTSFQHQLLPVVSSSVDLHSMAQLYLSGYKDLYTMFVYFDDRQPYHITVRDWLRDHVPYLRNKTTTEINDAIIHGVLHAYKDQHLPYRIMELPRCSAYEIGFLLSSFMCEIMYLAYVLNVDPFNQPHVESYKKYTRVSLGM